MKIIEINQNQKENWNEFIIKNNNESFLQAWQWGEFQKNTGKKIFRIGIEENGKIIAVALLVKHNLPLGKSYLYCPRGPVISLETDNQKSEVVHFLFGEIQKIAKKEKAIFLRIDPPNELNDKLGIINYKSSLYIMKKLANEIQPKDTLILNLEKSEEDLLKEMKQKTRYNIRLSKKRGVQIKSYQSGVAVQEEFMKKVESFWDLVEETSRRDEFISHSRNYYQKQLKSLCIEDKTGLSAKLYLAEFEGKVIAANVVLFFGDLCIYLHGSSSNEHRNLMAPYLLQWQQIIDAKKIGCRKYDFWGITIDGEKESWQGITKFKKGFSGDEMRYAGAYDLVIDKKLYWIYTALKKIRNLRK